MPAISRLGQSAIMLAAQGELSLGVQRRIWALAHEARAWPHVRETIAGMNNLTLIFDWKNEDSQTLESRLRAAWSHHSESSERGEQPRRIDIPVRYGGDDGPDLAVVAAAAGMSGDEVIECHTAGEYVAYFLGFKPGFAYLGGLDPRLATPRLAQPRPRVAAGSVGIGGDQTGVYAVTSPGGWRLIGRTSLGLFDPQRTPAALLAPGDRVRFTRS